MIKYAKHPFPSMNLPRWCTNFLGAPGCQALPNLASAPTRHLAHRRGQPQEMRNTIEAFAHECLIEHAEMTFQMHASTKAAVP